MPQASTTANIAIITHSPEHVNIVSDGLKNRGHLAQTYQLTSSDALFQKMSKVSIDIVLIYPDCDKLLDSINSTIKKHAPSTPIIAFVNTWDFETIEPLLQKGLFAVAPVASEIISLATINNAINYTVMYSAQNSLSQKLDSLEDQNQQILNTSDTALAFIIDGLHAYANDKYLALFEYANFEDLSITPLSSLISSDEADIKKSIRDIQNKKITELNINAVNNQNKEKIIVNLQPAVHEGEACIQVNVNKDLSHLAAPVASNQHAGNITATRQELMSTIDSLKSEKGSGFFIIYILIQKYDSIQKKLGIKLTEIFSLEFSQRIKVLIPNTDIVCRFNDDGFCLVSSSVHAAEIAIMCEKAQKALANYTFEIEDRTINIHTSCVIGHVATNTTDAYDFLGSVIEKASSEHMPADALVEISSERTKFNDADNEMLSNIKHALSNGFNLNFQPIITLQGNGIPFYEVFVRMKAPKSQEILMPRQFLPVATAAGLSTKIDQRIIFDALKTLVTSSQKNALIIIQLNIDSIENSNLLSFTQQTMKKLNIGKGSIVFMLQENDISLHASLVKKFFADARAIGCLSGIKGFSGTEDSMEILKKINCQFASLSGSISQGLEDSEDNLRVLTQSVEILHHANIKAIAPYIESPMALSQLWQTPIDFVQGTCIQAPIESLSYDF